MTEFQQIFNEAKDLCTELEIYIPLIIERKISNHFDESAKIQHNYKTKKKIMFVLQRDD